VINKKGAMGLSIQAIVIIVIGLVVLGLALAFTMDLFKKAELEIPGVIALARLNTEPTSSNPITVPEIVELERKKSKTMTLGFYNKGEGTAVNAILELKQCKSEGGIDNVELEKTPTITSISANVAVSEGQGYSIILSENGLSEGIYICEMGVKCEKDCPVWLESEYYELKNFFVKVVS
jgi:hypothetical protein